MLRMKGLNEPFIFILSGAQGPGINNYIKIMQLFVAIRFGGAEEETQLLIIPLQFCPPQ